MLTDFFLKKRIKTILTIFFALFFIVIFGYKFVFQNTSKLSVSAEFYFLVSDSLHIEASTQLVKLEGGAGYLLENGDREYAVFSMYLNQEDGERALNALIKEGKQVELLCIKPGVLYLKSRIKKKNKNCYLGAFNTLNDCMEILNQTIIRLDKGATQESEKRILGQLVQLFAFMVKEYESLFPDFSMVCNAACEELKLLVKNIVYVRDLRYLLCDLSEQYLRLAADFSL